MLFSTNESSQQPDSLVASLRFAFVRAGAVGQASVDWLASSPCRVTLGSPCQPCQRAKASSTSVSGGHRYCHRRPSGPDLERRVNSLRSI
ncbi:hypothetical protein Q8A67_011242 [Cirrhinus molitorella]|uniref:Uncharacterized protein n=1 Tax=Cirrhinus molitorella TaxID=172907 RepID=A0AA88TXV6_9TELE|nr:hypothetical protein Q8A67_011242 [Cirrhinus molitorella]